jgi:hypothetical protein
MLPAGFRRELLAVTLVLSGLVAIATWPQVRQISTGVVDLGDPLLNSWTLAWVAHTLPTHPTALFDANIFYPETHTLAYSEALVVPALLVAPVLWLGGDPILAHNLLLLGGYLLSGLAMYVLVRALTSHAGAALVAAVVFALYPYRLEAYPKVQLQLTFWMPFALLAVHRLGSRPSTRAAVLAGLLAALQVYSCVYYGLFAVVPLACVAMGAVLAAPAGVRGRTAGAIVAAGLVGAILCAPLVGPYRAAARVVGARSPDEVGHWSASPADFLRAHPDNALYGNPSRPGDGEKRLFPGLVAPALGLAALAPPVSGLALVYGVAGVVSADLALGFNGVGYRSLYAWLPPFRAVRVPARFAMLVGLALAVLAGVGVERLCRGRSGPAQWAMVAALVGLVTVESRPRALELREIDDPRPAVYGWLAAQPRGVVCEYPVGNLQGRGVPQDATYMYYSTRHWQPLVNGYSGFEPRSYLELLDHLANFPDDPSLAYLRQRGVRYLLVHNVFSLSYIHGDFEEDIRRLKARPDLEWVGRFAWRGGGETDAFRFRE